MQNFKRFIPSAGWLPIVLLSLIITVIVALAVLSCVPPVSRDALTHHLLIPKLYLKHGGMVELPEIVFSYYPMNLDLLYMIPLVWGNDIMPKFIHFGFSLFTAGLIYHQLKKQLDQTYALLGALFFLSLPIIIKLSTTVYVDLGLCFFSFASIIYLLKWMEDEFRIRHLILSAVFCGLALGTKYNGLIVCFILTFCVPFYYSRIRYAAERDSDQLEEKKGVRFFPKSIGYGLLFLVISLAVFSPWMIRNYLWTDNPVFPLFNYWFSQDWFVKKEPVAKIVSSAVSAASAAKLNHFSLRTLIYDEPLWQILLIPVRVFFQGQDGNPQFFDGKLNPFLFMFSFFAFLSVPKQSAVKTQCHLFATFSLLFLLFSFLNTDMRIRYIVPIVPPMVLLCVMGVYRTNRWFADKYSKKVSEIGKRCILMIVVAMLLLNAVYLIAQYGRVHPMSYIAGKVSREAYIRKHIAEYPVIQYANANLPERARILSLFLGNRSYYSDIEMEHSSAVFSGAVRRGKTSRGIWKRIAAQGITHLLIRHDLYNGWLKNNFSKTNVKEIEGFFSIHSRLLFHHGVYALYELTP